jgi:hypothetical protein
MEMVVRLDTEDEACYADSYANCKYLRIRID